MVGKDFSGFPEDLEYITKYEIDSDEIPPYYWNPYRKTCCNCVDNDCSDPEKCSCLRLTRDVHLAHEHPSEQIDAKSFGYQHNRLYESIPTGIFECHSSCKCTKSCGNRVVQKPLSHRLEIFKTKDCGWGVRALNDLPKGAFISRYVGDLLPDAELDERATDTGDTYFFTLSTRENVDLDARRSKRTKKSKTNQYAFEEKHIYVNYFPSMIRFNTKDKKWYAVDAKRRGNFTRFVNVCIKN